MYMPNLCTHSITMRVWRQSSETRQAALDEEREAILNGEFVNKLEFSLETGQNAGKPCTGGLESLGNTPGNCSKSVVSASQQGRLLAQYELGTVAIS